MFGFSLEDPPYTPAYRRFLAHSKSIYQRRLIVAIALQLCKDHREIL
jgi:hypothetical protein